MSFRPPLDCRKKSWILSFFLVKFLYNSLEIPAFQKEKCMHSKWGLSLFCPFQFAPSSTQHIQVSFGTKGFFCFSLFFFIKLNWFMWNFYKIYAKILHSKGVRRWRQPVKHSNLATVHLSVSCMIKLVLPPSLKTTPISFVFTLYVWLFILTKFYSTETFLQVIKIFTLLHLLAFNILKLLF